MILHRKTENSCRKGHILSITSHEGCKFIMTDSYDVPFFERKRNRTVPICGPLLPWTRTRVRQPCIIFSPLKRLHLLTLLSHRAMKVPIYDTLKLEQDGDIPEKGMGIHYVYPVDSDVKMNCWTGLHCLRIAFCHLIPNCSGQSCW